MIPKRLRRLKKRNLPWLFLMLFFICSVGSLVLTYRMLSSVLKKTSHDIPKPTAVERPTCAFLYPSSENVVSFSGKDLIRAEKEITSSWGKETGVRVLIVGTAGYIKRDLPAYQFGFKAPRFEILNPYAHAKKNFKPLLDPKDFDILVCLSFNTDLCLSPEEFPSVVPRMKKVNRVNHLRTVLWSKHAFCTTMNKAVQSFREDSLDFFFPCWVLPDQYDDLIENRLQLTRWISKPRSLGAGMGITVVDSLSEISPRSTHVIQEYMQNPSLLPLEPQGTLHKWDARTYVLVTSLVPLRAYVFSRGLVRLAMTPFSADCKSHNQTACLTNTSINKKIGVGSAKDITWSFQKLETHFGAQVYGGMFSRMVSAIGMVLVSKVSLTTTRILIF